MNKEVNDYYFDEMDLSVLKTFFREEGVPRVLEKGELLVRQGWPSSCSS